MVEVGDLLMARFSDALDVHAKVSTHVWLMASSQESAAHAAVYRRLQIEPPSFRKGNELFD